MVGAFPEPGSRVYGGIVTSCRILRESSLSQRALLTFIDSTQVSNPPPGLFVRFLLARKRIERYMKTVRRVEPDAVVLFCSAGASFLEKCVMAWYARINRVPAMLFPRGGALINKHKDGFWRLYARILTAGAASFLCQGRAWQVFAVEKLGFSYDACPVIPNWSATPELLAIGRKREEEHPNYKASVRFLFVGWVEEAKGVGDLMEAFDQIRKKYDVRLQIVGDGNAMSFVREFAADRGIGEDLDISGWLEGEALLDAYREADVLLLPSWSEGLPNAMIEAMAAGLAVIATRVGSVPDFLSDRKEGLLINPKDSAGLVAACEQVVTDAALRRSMGRAAHAFALREFGVDVAVDRILKAVESVTLPSAAATHNEIS